MERLLAQRSERAYYMGVTATVTDKMQVALPPEICAELGIEPGVQLSFRSREGRLEAVKIPPGGEVAGRPALAEVYTSERNAEELAIQKGCSCAVPDDFPA